MYAFCPRIAMDSTKRVAFVINEKDLAKATGGPLVRTLHDQASGKAFTVRRYYSRGGESDHVLVDTNKQD